MINFEFLTGAINLNNLDITKEILIEELSSVVDDDFNGKNGEEYFTENGISQLEESVNKYFDKFDIVKTIEEVLKECYSDNYYLKYDINVVKTFEGYISITVAYIYNK